MFKCLISFILCKLHEMRTVMKTFDNIFLLNLFGNRKDIITLSPKRNAVQIERSILC